MLVYTNLEVISVDKSKLFVAHVYIAQLTIMCFIKPHGCSFVFRIGIWMWS